MAAKYKKLQDELHRQLEQLPRGSRLPSVRQLMREFGVSQATVDRALQDLKAAGLIESRAGSGLYKLSPADRANRSLRIGLALYDYPTPVTGFIEKAFGSALAARGHELRKIVYPWDRRLGSYLAKGPLDALLILPTNERLTGEEIVSLGNIRIPWVMLNVVPRSLPLDAVGGDNELGGAMAAEYFIRQGHRNLAVIGTEPPGQQVEERIDGFRKRVELAGLPTPLILRGEIVQGESSCVKAHELLSAQLRREPDRFTALFMTSFGCEQGAYKAFHDAGVRLPDEVSLIGFDDMPEVGYFIPGLTVVTQNYTVWAEEALKIIQTRLGGEAGGIRQVIVPPLAVERESVAPAPVPSALEVP